jgi:hypothetical protein
MSDSQTVYAMRSGQCRRDRGEIVEVDVEYTRPVLQVTIVTNKNDLDIYDKEC